MACYEYKHGQISQLEVRLITSGQPLQSGYPLTYSSGGGRHLETAIHIVVLVDNLHFIFMVYSTIPYVVMALKKGIPFKCVQNNILRTRSAVGVVYG